jgi:hypothetical protein
MNDEVAGPIEHELRNGQQLSKGNIANGLNRLESLNDKLYDSLTKLEDTIQPVLCGSDPSPSDSTKPSPEPTSVMADRIEKIEVTLDNRIEYLQSIIRRIDL